MVVTIYPISQYFRVDYILANLASKVYIANIGIAQINGLGCII